jgi:hypothetical protein
MIYPKLHVHHNHGTLILANAVIEHGTAVGTCVGGGYTNRLFHASSHHKYETNVTATYPVYGREPRPAFTTSEYTKTGLEVSPVPGEFHIDVCFCG